MQLWCYTCERSDTHTRTHTFTLFKVNAIFAFRTGFRTGYTQYRKMNLIFCAWVWQGNLVISCNILCLFHDLKQLEWRTFWIVWEACRKMEASASEKATALADLEASFCSINCSGACQDLLGGPRVHRRAAKLPNLQSKSWIATLLQCLWPCAGHSDWPSIKAGKCTGGGAVASFALL